MSSDKPSNLYTLYIDTSIHTSIRTYRTYLTYLSTLQKANKFVASKRSRKYLLILLAAFALQQRKCIVRLSPSPSRSPFCIFFFGSSSATDHKRKVLKSLLSVNQIKVKVMQLLYIIYNVPLSLSFSVSLLLLLSLILPISIFLCLLPLFLSRSHLLPYPFSSSLSPFNCLLVASSCTSLMGRTNYRVLYRKKTRASHVNSCKLQ